MLCGQAMSQKTLLCTGKRGGAGEPDQGEARGLHILYWANGAQLRRIPRARQGEAPEGHLGTCGETLQPNPAAEDHILHRVGPLFTYM